MFDSLTSAICVFIIYYIIISIYGVSITISDKKRAVKGKRRISENHLMITGLIGASLPMLITMKIIRHKTKHLKFMIGLQVESLFHIILLILILNLI